MMIGWRSISSFDAATRSLVSEFLPGVFESVSPALKMDRRLGFGRFFFRHGRGSPVFEVKECRRAKL
jgi:hypothetical protein